MNIIPSSDTLAIHILYEHVDWIIAFRKITIGWRGEWFGLEDFAVRSSILEAEIFRAHGENNMKSQVVLLFHSTKKHLLKAMEKRMATGCFPSILRTEWEARSFPVLLGRRVMKKEGNRESQKRTWNKKWNSEKKYWNKTEKEKKKQTQQWFANIYISKWDQKTQDILWHTLYRVNR